MTNKPKSILQLRIQKQIQRLLLDLFSKSDMSLGGKSFFLSISEVDISPDLKNLKILVDIPNIDKQNQIKVIKNLNENNIFVIKKILAEKVNLRYVPEVLFVLDESNEKLFKMKQIIDKEAKFFDDK
ncbi:MAG TPA: ribosome-binding factor A [Rickettsiales bacterium]|nr:ribosome-binding factor A [Rickettsiales bacterium]